MLRKLLSISMFKKLLSISKFMATVLIALIFLALNLFLNEYFGFLDGEGGKSLFFKKETLEAVTKELFFALLISAIIIITIEASSREEQDEAAKRAHGEVKDLVEAARTDQEARAKELAESVSRAISDASSKLNEFSEANLIAQRGILKQGVDEMSAAAKDAAFNVLRAAGSNDFPQEIFVEIKKSILGVPFVRSEHLRTLVLKAVADFPELVLMTVRQTYVVKNVNPSTQTLRTFIVLPITESRNKSLTKFHFLKAECIGEPFPIPTSYPYVNDSEGTAAVEACKRISNNSSEEIFAFEGISVPSGASIRITMDFDVAKDISGNEVWTCLTPTMNGELVLRSEVPNMYLRAIALHRDTLVASRDNENTPSYKRWSFSTPVLPYQGNVAYWGPMPSQQDDSQGNGPA